MVDRHTQQYRNRVATGNLTQNQINARIRAPSELGALYHPQGTNTQTISQTTPKISSQPSLSFNGIAKPNDKKELTSAKENVVTYVDPKTNTQVTITKDRNTITTEKVDLNNEYVPAYYSSSMKKYAQETASGKNNTGNIIEDTIKQGIAAAYVGANEASQWVNDKLSANRKYITNRYKNPITGSNTNLDMLLGIQQGILSTPTSIGKSIADTALGGMMTIESKGENLKPNEIGKSFNRFKESQTEYISSDPGQFVGDMLVMAAGVKGVKTIKSKPKFEKLGKNTKSISQQYAPSQQTTTKGTITNVMKSQSKEAVAFRKGLSADEKKFLQTRANKGIEDTLNEAKGLIKQYREWKNQPRVIIDVKPAGTGKSTPAKTNPNNQGLMVMKKETAVVISKPKTNTNLPKKEVKEVERLAKEYVQNTYENGLLKGTTKPKTKSQLKAETKELINKEIGYRKQLRAKGIRYDRSRQHPNAKRNPQYVKREQQRLAQAKARAKGTLTRAGTDIEIGTVKQGYYSTRAAAVNRRTQTKTSVRLQYKPSEQKPGTQNRQVLEVVSDTKTTTTSAGTTNKPKSAENKPKTDTGKSKTKPVAIVKPTTSEKTDTKRKTAQKETQAYKQTQKRTVKAATKTRQKQSTKRHLKKKNPENVQIHKKPNRKSAIRYEKVNQFAWLDIDKAPKMKPRRITR